MHDEASSRLHIISAQNRPEVDDRAACFAHCAEALAIILLPFRVMPLYASPLGTSKYWPGPGVDSPAAKELREDLPLMCHAGAL